MDYSSACLESSHNRLRLDKVRFRFPVSQSLSRIDRIYFVRSLFGFALPLMFVLFLVSFMSLYNTVINSNHNGNWFANPPMA